MNKYLRSMSRYIAIIVLLLSLSSVAFGATASSITMYSGERGQIKWTFDGSYTVGQFVNGEWWVYDDGGGVVITGITPEPNVTTGRNGSMINPSTRFHAYDSSEPSNYNADLMIGDDIDANPCTLSAGDSLISTVSKTTTTSIYDLTGVTVTNSMYRLYSAAVLTVIDYTPTATEFRPAYVGTRKHRFDYADINTALLPKLSLPAGASFDDIYGGGLGRRPGLGTVAEELGRYVKRPYIDHVGGTSQARYCHPCDNQPNYWRRIGNVIAECAVALCTDLDTIVGAGQMDELLIPFLQVGIDSNAVMTDVGGYAGSGLTVYPTVLADILFPDVNMDISRYPTRRWKAQCYYIEDRLGDYLGTTGGALELAPPNNIYPSTVTVGNVRPGVHWETPAGKVPAWRELVQANVEHEQYDKTDIPSNLLVFADKNWDTREYYRQLNSSGYVGQVLAATIMGAEGIWNHPATFDYIERYVAHEHRNCDGSTGDWPKYFIDDVWPLWFDPDSNGTPIDINDPPPEEWVSPDRFETDTTGSYNKTDVEGSGTFTWDSTGERGYIQTGDNFQITVDANLLGIDSAGTFSFDLYVEAVYPLTIEFYVDLMQDATNFYRLSVAGDYTGYQDYGIQKFVDGSETADDANTNTTTHITEGQTYSFTFYISPTSSYVTINGGTKLTIDTETTSFTLNRFLFSVFQSDVYLDNITWAAAVTVDEETCDPLPCTDGWNNDDFSLDATACYTTRQTSAGNGTSTFVWDGNEDCFCDTDCIGDANGLMTTFDNGNLYIKATTPQEAQGGEFEFDFKQLSYDIEGSRLYCYLIQDANNYYVLKMSHNYSTTYDDANMVKVVDGSVVDNSAVDWQFDNTTLYTDINIDFTPTATTATFGGQTLTINTDATPITVSSFEFFTWQGTINIDNLEWTRDATAPAENRGTFGTTKTTKTIKTGRDF